MSFLKQKEQEFNFFVKNKEKKKKKISQLELIISGFIALQIGFLGANIHNFEKTVNEKSLESQQLLNSYNKVKEAMKKGEQTEIIANYAQMNNTSYLSRILSGSLLQHAMFYSDNVGDKKNQYHRMIDKEYQINVQAETVVTLKKIYETSLKTPIQENLLQNCSFLDISCHLMNHYLKKAIEPTIKKQEDAILRIQYNINHPEEYKKWSEQLSKNQEKDMNYSQTHPDAYLSPGDKYVKNLNKV